MLAFARRIHASASSLGDLAAGEFVLFISYISCGLALPISHFFLLLLDVGGRNPPAGWRNAPALILR